MNESVVILRTLKENPDATQRDIASALDVSLGKTNRLIQETADLGLLEKDARDEGRGRNVGYRITEAGEQMLQEHRVDAALILASGFGSRFVPLTYEMPKGLLEVYGERMIERQIRQLHAVGITNITIMVGYLKEKFDYLIDKYQVDLIYNPEYSCKNTLATMYHARDFLRGKNCYILSSDNWMRENMYHSFEAVPWYAATYMKGETAEWAMTTGKNGVIKEVKVGGENAWCMYGPVFFTKQFSDVFLRYIETYYKLPGTEQYYWEDVLIRNLRNLPEMYINRQPEGEVYEFENLEELRTFDEKYVNHSGSRAMQLVADVFKIPESDIVEIRCLKAGMTNKSWLFRVEDDSNAPEEYRGKSFICRIPGPGTEKLINRKQEGDVYKAVVPLGITEELVYFNSANGYKISRYYENARNADYRRPEELKACMTMLKKLHNSGIRLDHVFDFKDQLLRYEQYIRDAHGEIPFEDYPTIRMQAMEVFDWLEKQNRPRTIAHIDCVKDNFLFTQEGLRMIDWEYCGMSDPLADIAMAAIYSYMNQDEVKATIEAYRGEDGGIAMAGLSGDDTFALVTAYMGVGGLLWSLWCAYKIIFGENFGDYTLKMYRYFKNSYQILRKMNKI